MQPALTASPPFLSHRGGRIVLPLDFSACAERALPRALAIAEHAGAEVHLLHVLPAPASTASPDGADEAQWFDLWREERARARLETIRLAYRYGLHRRLAVPLQPAVTVHSDVAEGIVAYAEQHDADLIVMGTHGWGCGAAQGMGSVARQVIATSGRPVMTLPVTRPVKADVRRVVTLADPLDPSDALGGYARQLADLCGTDVFFLGPSGTPSPGKLPRPWGQCGKGCEIDSLETTDVLVIPGSLASTSIQLAVGGLLAVPDAKRSPLDVGALA